MRTEAEYPRGQTRLIDENGLPTRAFANLLELLTQNVRLDTPFYTGNSASGVAAGQTRYIGTEINATEANVYLVTPKAGTWRNLYVYVGTDRKSTRLNSSHIQKSRMPSSA